MNILNLIGITCGVIALFCWGTVFGISIAHRDAVKVGVAKYMINPENGKTYLYWNTINGPVREN